jgi:hypothetical protein
MESSSFQGGFSGILTMPAAGEPINLIKMKNIGNKPPGN